jgi:ribosomal protein S18 acetylase RimI-like enzyme
MKIRILSADNCDEIANLWCRAGLHYQPEGRDSKRSLARQMKANPDFFLGAFEGSRLIGVVILSSDLRKGWMNRLAIDPSYRRKGVAKALIEKSERVLRKHGLKMFCSLIDEDNAASRALFEKCGFTRRADILYYSKRESSLV